MSYIAIITDVTRPDGMPLWESAEQPTAEVRIRTRASSTFTLAARRPIVPIDDRGEYAVWAQSRWSAIDARSDADHHHH